MLQEGDYPFQQEASLRGARGEASATIAIWNVPERRPEHEFKSAFSTHIHSKKLSTLIIKPPNARARGGLLVSSYELDANGLSDATIKYAWVTP
jgi:hypothetical protein